MTPPPSPGRRVALVTGTSSGIGEAVVRHFCQLGHQVLAVDFNPAGREVAEEAGASFFQADLTDGEACKAAVAEAIKRLWNEGHRQPALSGMVHDQFPGLSVQAFNRAADIAWKEIDGGAA